MKNINQFIKVVAKFYQLNCDKIDVEYKWKINCSKKV
jgi:hypothetical protein